MQQRHIKLLNRILAGGQLRLERERVPAAVHENPQLMLARRCGDAETDDVENFLQFFEQFGGRQAVQIFQHAVVGQNLHLIVRKNYREKLAALAPALARLKNPRRRRAAMMSVRDVEKRNLRELRFDEFDFIRIGNVPRRMADAVLGRKINLRFP